MKPFISFAIKKCTVPSKDRGSLWWGWLRAGFTPEYSLQLKKKARPEGREILVMGCLQGAP
ncbi:hypothetical protein AIW19_23360 [Salmonella enterica]|nr:hypothetical protein [Salmonella enterica]EBU6803389.1 hypothetical protein [Salmonella enterica subsp. enterica serovar Haifa]EBV4848541.1 hypothetical protein [Salmonella enterica subsp. enterica serovar Typhimurium]EDD4629219.1 hypothetical protein [Salmonella enterica subsp. enterica serovar Newport]EBA3806153.1 hypothetical protein [Salmonella enterica]